EAIETFAKISTNTTEVLSLVKGFDFSTLQSTMKDLQAHALKQEEESAAWTKQDTSEIKSMITEIYHAFKGQSSSAPSSSVTPTLALTNILVNVKGKNATNTATEEPPSHIEGEIEVPKMAILIHQSNLLNSQEAPKIYKGKVIATESKEDPSKKPVPASTIARPDPDEEVKVPYMINGKMYYLADKEMQAYLDKEEKLRKAVEEARLLAISKPKVIKVVQEEAENIGLDPKKIASSKVGEKFKKAQDAEHEVLKRQHTEKVRKSLKLRKHKFDSYIWTISSRLKPEPITDIKIHPKTKPVVIIIYRGTDGRNFDVHKPFSFAAFGIFELDELREIIPKKKNGTRNIWNWNPRSSSWVGM
ncbi:hypothetical protein Tco_0459200, partial [Tanacetum coccineum]